MSGGLCVIKVTGDAIESPAAAGQLAEAIAEISEKQRPIVVHGGGRIIDRWASRMGLQAQFQDGLRVTDEPMLQIAEMVLCGQVNKRMVLALLAQGVDALGLSGIDRGLLRAERLSPRLGWVGRVVKVRGEILKEMGDEGIIPVIAPIAAGPDGRYNVNADHAAGAIAAAVGAAQAVFLTNVPGVLAEGTLAPRLDAAQARQMIAQGAIHGGMIPKVHAALEALESGAARVVITDLAGLRLDTGTALVR